jgi:hypothetical protein
MLLDEAERALPGLWAQAHGGSTPAEIAKVLSARFALFPQPERTDGEWTAWWTDYNDALLDLCPDAIEAGMAEYVRQPDSEFFPKPGKLRDLSQSVPNRLARAVQVAERAVRWARQEAAAQDTAIVPERRQPSEAEKASVRHMLEAFSREMAERAPQTKRPTLPPISGPVDERGLTQAMRDHMGIRP